MYSIINKDSKQKESLTIISLPFHIIVDYIFLLIRLCLTLRPEQFDRGRAANLPQDGGRLARFLCIPIRNLHKSFHLQCQLLPLGGQELAIASPTSAADLVKILPQQCFVSTRKRIGSPANLAPRITNTTPSVRWAGFVSHFHTHSPYVDKDSMSAVFNLPMHDTK